MRVGRSALDEDAIRLIEEHNPDVRFDWTQILRGDQDAEAVPAGPKAARAPRVPVRGPQGPRVQARVPEVQVPEVRVPVPVQGETERAASAPEPREPEPIELAEPEAERLEPEPPAALGDSAALRRLGAEGLIRLRARYAEVMARITERVPDAEKQAELKTQAERLNPDTWVTDPEVSAGLEEYESSFEALRAVIGGGVQHRRRRRRSSGSQPGNP